MVNVKYVKVGRLVRVLRGPRADRVAVITDIIDANRVLVENPKDEKMWRHVQSIKNIEPLRQAVKINHNCKTKKLMEALDASKALDKYAATKQARIIAGKRLLAEATDFERYQLRVAKRARAHWARKIFAEKDAKKPISYTSRILKRLEKSHKKFADKHLKERHERIKKYFAARKAKKASKGKK